MKLEYRPAIQKGQNHYLEINGEGITTTRAKEVLNFAKPRLTTRMQWRMLKEAVNNAEALSINGGD